MEKIFKILKESFSDLMTEDAEKTIQSAIELLIAEKVKTKTDEITAKLEVEYAEKVATAENDLKEKLNLYIEKSNEDLINEHLKNIESETKVELAERLYTSIVSTLKESNVNVSIEQTDIIAKLEKEKHELEDSLNEAVKEIEESRKVEMKIKKDAMIAEMTLPLVDTDKERVTSLIENVIGSINDLDVLKEKIEAAIKIVTGKEKETKNEDGKTIEEKFDKTVKPTDKYVPGWFKK